DEVALRSPRLPRLVDRAEGVVAFVRPHAFDLDGAVGAEGGDDVVGAAIVECLRVGGDGGANAFGDLCERHERTLDRSVQSRPCRRGPMSTFSLSARGSPASISCTGRVKR